MPPDGRRTHGHCTEQRWLLGVKVLALALLASCGREESHFTLTVAEDGAQPTTHRVYATKQFAERLAKQPVEPGCLVEVAGLAERRQERQPDGARLSVHYLYCFGIRVLVSAPS